jgi:hypothetical protein
VLHHQLNQSDGGDVVYPAQSDTTEGLKLQLDVGRSPYKCGHEEYGTTCCVESGHFVEVQRIAFISTVAT